MPNPAKKSDKGTLPDPELNPLLNPLLAEHMGRWAEVYFTTPPEKRGEAVAELLRELEAASAAPNFQVSNHQVNNHKEIPEINENGIKETVAEKEPAEVLDFPREPAEPGLICNVCAHENQQGQRFCGMCGSILQISEEEFAADNVPPEPIEPATWAEPKPPLENDAFDYERFRFSEAGKPYAAKEVWPAAENRSHRMTDDNGPRFANDVPKFATQPPSVPYRYRLYVGAVLAILFAVLLYMAWRGTQAMSSGPQSPPSRIVPAAQPAAPTPAEEPASKTRPLPVEKPVEKVEKKENPPTAPVQSTARASENSAKQPAARSAPLPPEPKTAEVASSPSAGQTGAEELSMAEKYLNGYHGSARDSGEAARWLWKAVAKGNPAATITLSDLYLRGDGVPKSCDQARLLLDAASRKGVKAAADRLRNLPAFGCQ